MKVFLRNVRLSFNNLFEPKEFTPGDGKPRYSARFLVEPGSENDVKIQEAIKAEADLAMGKKSEMFLKQCAGNANKYCYLDGDLKEYEGHAGKKYIACHRKGSDGRPTVIDRDRTPLNINDGKPYAGCYVNAFVTIYIQSDGQFPGVRASFTGVQFSKDGDAFSGASAASAEDFDDVSNTEEDDLM